MDDTTLIERAARGDEDAFELLVRRHADACWGLARSMIRDDGRAEDAVQETFLKAYRSLGGFRGEASARTWLLQICRRTCLDRLRRNEPAVVSLDSARAARAPAAQPEVRIALSEALAALDAVDREAFTLVDVLGYSREEASRIVGVPPSTMRSRVTRARRRLADALTDEDERSARGR